MAKFTLWLTLMERLPTKDILLKFGVNTDNICSFCQEAETINNLFFECRMTSKIWEEILCMIGFTRNSTNWTEEKECLVRKTTMKD